MVYAKLFMGTILDGHIFELIVITLFKSFGVLKK